jgi:uncharacterized protein with PIN domain
MTVRKLSISVSPEVEQMIKIAAEQAGVSVSAWLAAAAMSQAGYEKKLAEGRAAAKELIAEYEAEFGPIPPHYREEARQALIDYGLIQETKAAS